MSTPNLSLNATSANALFAQLQATDISVPPITEGRTSQHREQYVMTRFLATAARAGKITFPLTLTHGDKPDFILDLAGSEVGVECVEAVPEEWYEIAALQEKLYSEAMYFGQTFRPGERVFERHEKHDIASGKQAGFSWVGDMAKQQWVAAMEYFIKQKTEKLRAGNYSSHKTMWLNSIHPGVDRRCPTNGARVMCFIIRRTDCALILRNDSARVVCGEYASDSFGG